MGNGWMDGSKGRRTKKNIPYIYMKSAHLFTLFFILVVLGILYKRFEEKQKRETGVQEYQLIQDYLLGDKTDLYTSKKPILWLHVPFEYNARNWYSFGSRSSNDLNQPYLYLTVKSIIRNCDDDFTICIIDDQSFARLLPHWQVDMTRISDPLLSNMRLLAMMKLLYRYGGMICPISFVCLKPLHGLYLEGTRGNRFFLGEMVGKNISTETDFHPSLQFCGAPKECDSVRDLCHYMERILSTDYTSQSTFLDEFNRWCKQRIERKEIRMIHGSEIGTKTMDGKPILLEDLMENHYLNVSRDIYGIYIPADEILHRRSFEWFARMSPRQVITSNTIIGNYLLLSQTDETGGILESLQSRRNKATDKKFVGFWRTPLQDVYGLKPNYLGNNMSKVPYPRR